MTTSDEIRQQLIEFCDQVGQDPLLVQGAGGNVSWKQDGVFWVKASGTWLSEAKTKDIFVPIELAPILESIGRNDYTVEPVVANESTLRPSIETLLHALMPHRVVVHLHAVEVMAIAVRESWIDDLNGLFDKSTSWAGVPYAKPGAPLAEAVTNVLREADADVLVLQNHGVVVGADSVPEVADLLRRVIKQVATPVAAPAEEAVGTVPPILEDLGKAYSPFPDSRVHALVKDASLFSLMQHGWALYPDHVVFLGAEPFLASDAQAQFDEASADVLFVEDEGVFITDQVTEAKREQLVCYFEVMRRQPEGTKLHSLDQGQIGELLNWDAEKYRLSITK